MFKLEKTIYEKIYKLYLKHDSFFSIIAAVLLDEQNGVVYGDCAQDPQRVYVEHIFGFAQLFGMKNADFDIEFKSYLLYEKKFMAPKVRLYTPIEPDFLLSTEFANFRSERQRFVLEENSIEVSEDRPNKLDKSIYIEPLRKEQLIAVEAQFNLVNRFWRNSEEFISKSHALVAWHETKPIAICYAFAIANGKAEIDVLTSIEYRRMGLGKSIVKAFKKNCKELGLQPVWDCFTNNTGSMALCIASGFKPLRPAYPFYTFNK